MTKIVWNGCDSYIEADKAVERGHDFDGEKLYHGGKEFSAFEATRINIASLPVDEDGDPIMDGVLGTETGNLYRLKALAEDNDMKSTIVQSGM